MGNSPALQHIRDLQSAQKGYGDQFALDNVKQLDAAIQNIQANPYLSPDEKAGRIQNAQREKLKWMTPMIGRSRLNQILQQSPELKPIQAQTGNVPAQPEGILQLPPQSLAAPPSGSDNVPNDEVPPAIANVQPPPMNLPATPAKQVELTPPTTADVMASGAPSNMFVPVALANGTTMMLPMQQAVGILKQQEGNAGRMGVQQYKTEHAPGQWDLQVGTKNGQPYAYYHSKTQNENTDLQGNALKPEDLQGFTPMGKGALKETYVPDASSETGFSKIAYDTATGVVHSKQSGVLPPRGFIATDTITKDQFGNETVQHRQPQVPGAGGVPNIGAVPNAKAQAANAPTPTAPKPVPVPAPMGAPNSPKQARDNIAAVAQGRQPVAQLDQNGHIPIRPGMNAQVAEAANQLLDGLDLDKLHPDKVRVPAAEMARQYGWAGQGAITPKEKILVNEAAAKLQQLYDSPALAVLDRGAVSRMKIAQAMKSSEKQGLFGTGMTALAASNLDNQEQEFLRLFNAAAGVISGLTPLTRGGRPTESSIHRLMSELPHVLQSASSSDAKMRIQQLLQEIKVAEQTKGTTALGENVNPNSSSNQSGLRVGQPVKLKNGQTGIIKAVHDDGSFDLE
jgi:hypothetical protein